MHPAPLECLVHALLYLWWLLCPSSRWSGEVADGHFLYDGGGGAVKHEALGGGLLFEDGTNKVVDG